MVKSMPLLIRVALVALWLGLMSMAAAAQPLPPTKPSPGVPISGHPGFAPWQMGMDIADGGDYRNVPIPSGQPALCLAECARDTRCAAATLTMPGSFGAPHASCLLKSQPGRFVPHPSALSAVKISTTTPPPPPPPPPVTANVSGQWSGPLGVYEMTQSGANFTWRVGGEIGQGTISGDSLQVTWTGGGSATGRITERSPQGLPTAIAWSNGVVFRRIGTSAPTVVTPPPPPPPPPPPATANLSGQWSGPLGVYEMTQSGASFTWRVGGEIGQGTISGDSLQVTWTGGGSATGRITERSPQGLPTAIAWSNGVVFRRIGSSAPTVVTPTASLSGRWSGPLGVYEMTQSGTSFTWLVGGEIGQGTISGDNLQVTWTGGGSATGRITERTPQGAPTVIAWSNGVVFRRIGP